MPAARRRTTPPAMNGNAGPPITSVKVGRSQKLCLCIYGEPGIGKTRFIGTGAELAKKEGKKILILRPPVDHTDSIVGTDADYVDEWVLRDWSEADDALLYARNEAAQKYLWVWLDSVSLFQDQGLDDLWEVIIAEKPHRARYGLDKGDYFINMQRLGRWVRHMVGAPGFHFGVTAHPRVTESTEDEEEPNEKLMPWVQGKMMAPKICGYMNVVGYYRWEKIGKAKTQTRVLNLNHTDRYYAKDQFSSTENGRIINPTLPKLTEAIMASSDYKTASASTVGEGRRTRRRRAAVSTGRK